MEFKNSTTTDDLLAALPLDNEDNRWELKSSAKLETASRGELKKLLGKYVSGFANSGGGHLVFGVSDDRKLEPCEKKVGNQSMKDYLSTMVEQCVEYPIRHFRVHRIPFTQDAEKSVFVVEIEDSPAAPHQAKEDKIYYYRIDGHTKAAPHFHVELLRNRMTKAAVEIVSVEIVPQNPELTPNYARLNLALRVKLENMSLQAATHCAVQVKAATDDPRWTATPFFRPIKDGVCIPAEQPLLLPTDKTIIVVHLRGEDKIAIRPTLPFEQMLESMSLLLRPVSHNHVGKEYVLSLKDTPKLLELQKWHRDFLQGR